MYTLSGFAVRDIKFYIRIFVTQNICTVFLRFIAYLFPQNKIKQLFYAGLIERKKFLSCGIIKIMKIRRT